MVTLQASYPRSAKESCQDSIITDLAIISVSLLVLEHELLL